MLKLRSAVFDLYIQYILIFSRYKKMVSFYALLHSARLRNRNPVCLPVCPSHGWISKNGAS